MNIFASSPCPIESAKNLDDKRVVKMILESAQLMSTAMHYHKISAPYKPTHVNHPCSIWIKRNKNNFKWVFEHFKALCSEYTNRYNKIHKTNQYISKFEQAINKLPEGEKTPLPNCTENKKAGVSYKHIENVHLAYKMYLSARWELDIKIPTWYKKG